MQAVILAAGRGTRLRPLTHHVPKPIIRVGSKALMEHSLSRLPDEIDELVIVVGYLAEQIMNYFGEEYAGRPIKYVKQKDLKGTASALWSCRQEINGRFLVMMGDDVYGREDLKRCLEHEQCILTREINGVFAGGRIILNSEGYLEDIREGKHRQKTSLVNTGAYVLNERIFDYEPVKLPGRSEYGLPQTMINMSKDHPVAIEKADFWLPVGDHQALQRANKILK